MADWNDRFAALGGKADEAMHLMKPYRSMQSRIGAKKKPVACIWGADAATTKEQELTTRELSNWLKRSDPEKLMISGRRSAAVAEGASVILRAALSTYFHESKSPKLNTIITGGAEGVDSIAFDLAREFDIALVGHYTPTKFARPSMQGCSSSQLVAGPSPVKDATAISSLLRRMRAPVHKDPRFPVFLAYMEGQWEARDTINASLADACIGFVNTKSTSHDGTKATLNIFANGIYAFPHSGSNTFSDGGRKDQIVRLQVI